MGPREALNYAIEVAVAQGRPELAAGLDALAGELDGAREDGARAMLQLLNAILFDTCFELDDGRVRCSLFDNGEPDADLWAEWRAAQTEAR